MIGKKRAKLTSTGSALHEYLAAIISMMPRKAFLALALMVCVNLSEGIGLLLLLPLMQLAGLDVQQGSVGRLAELISALMTGAGLRLTLTTVLILYVFISSLQAMLSCWGTTLNTALEQGFVAHLRRRLFRAITETNWLFFSRSRASDFTHGLTTELDRVGIATNALLSLLTNAAVLCVYILLAVRLSIGMTGLVFACSGALLFLLKGRMQRVRLSGEKLSVAYNDLYAAAIEQLNGMKTVKSYGVERVNADIFSELTERLARVYMRITRDQADLSRLVKIGSVLILSLILYFSLEVMSIPTAGMLLLLFLFARIMPQLANVHQSYQEFISNFAAFTTVKEMQTRCEAAAEPKAKGIERVELRYGIRFENVSFGYGHDAPAVITELDLFIRTGETVAIIGPSGAGKSTAADLVMALITPSQGRVLVDEEPLITERMRGWRDQIGYVAQDTFLFHDTVRANLLWACPGASEDEIQQALRLAAAEEFVSALPNGIETIVGDRGVRLSGGERQRLALARALLRKPSLLILDEATSALDFENERRIQSAITHLHGNMTILIITHRLSTIRHADVIYLLEQGSLIECGTWDELAVRENGRFKAFCQDQNIEHEAERKEALNIP